MHSVNASDFNESAPAALYGYRQSPVNPRSFLIVRGRENGEPETVGDYTILDKAEDTALSEKKVMNLVTLLNGRKKLMQLGHETKARVLYRILPEQDENGRSQVIFYHLGSEGNSVENALFRIERNDHGPE